MHAGDLTYFLWPRGMNSFLLHFKIERTRKKGVASGRSNWLEFIKWVYLIDRLMSVSSVWDLAVY